MRSNRQILREAANEFSAVCSAVFEKAIDSKGVFNTVIDFVQNMNEIPNTKAMDKLEYAVDLMDETPRAAGALQSQPRRCRRFLSKFTAVDAVGCGFLWGADPGSCPSGGAGDGAIRLRWSPQPPCRRRRGR